MAAFSEKNREKQKDRQKQHDSQKFERRLGVMMAGVLVTTGIIINVCFIFLLFSDIYNSDPVVFFLLLALIFFVAVNTGLAVLVIYSKRITDPINSMIDAADRISRGDFSVRIKVPEEGHPLFELSKQFNAMAEELSGIEIFRNSFINDFSHEFKTPLVSIRGFAKQLEKGNLTEEQTREYSGIIVYETERLVNMATNILQLNKLENQSMITERHTFSLDEQIRKCILLLEKQWEKKKIELNIDMQDISYYGNEDLMNHIWVNIISNSIKFVDEGGQIEITAAATEDIAVVSIKDNGIGIPQEALDHICEKFYQADSSHKSEGNGLGLALVNEIVKLCGGNISIESQVGVGTSVNVFLPLEKEPVDIVIEKEPIDADWSKVSAKKKQKPDRNVQGANEEESTDK